MRSSIQVTIHLLGRRRCKSVRGRYFIFISFLLQLFPPYPTSINTCSVYTLPSNHVFTTSDHQKMAWIDRPDIALLDNLVVIFAEDN